jgi:hypothetical protein
MAPSPAPPPDTREVESVAAVAEPVLRNLRITECYHRLSRAFAANTGPCANWCTFATWASRQAGCTIRGEDLLARLTQQASGASVRHPVESLWRALLRRGLFNPETRLGRVVRQIHSPFDVFERTSDAVARGNRKVFEEIGFEFARYLRECPPDAPPEALERFLEGLRPGEPPEGQDYLRRAFRRYHGQRLEPELARRAETILLANLEIGLHEQTRLQPEIREALESGPRTAEDLGGRILAGLHPKSAGWRAWRRKPACALLGFAGERFRRFAYDLTRCAVTDCLMALGLPGGVTLELGRHLDRAFPASLQRPSEGELLALLARFEPADPAADDCGARDWGELAQRMHFIAHLFRAFQEWEELLGPPFSVTAAAEIRAGKIPDGAL